MIIKKLQNIQKYYNYDIMKFKTIPDKKYHDNDNYHIIVQLHGKWDQCIIKQILFQWHLKHVQDALIN